MSSKDIKKGILSSYGMYGAEIIAGLLFTPFLINSLGQSEYGIYALMGAMIASFTLMDFGFGNAITRYVSQYRFEGRKDKESNLIGMSILIYLVIAALALLLGIVLYYFIEDIYSSGLTTNELNIAKAIFIIAILNLSVSFFIGALNAYIQAYEKFTIINLFNFVRLIIRIAVLYTLLSLGYKSIAVVIVDTILNLVTGIAYVVYSKFKLNLKISFDKMDRKLLKEISGYSFFVFLSNLADMFYWRVCLLILGAISGSTSVAVFAIGLTLASYYQYISGIINSKLFPRITQMVSSGVNGKDLTLFIVRTARIQVTLLGGILIAFQLYGSEFIYLWIGNDYSQAASIGLILMAAMIINAVLYPCVMILRAKKNDGSRTILQLALMIVGLILGLFLFQWLGVIGIALGLTIAIILLNWIVIQKIYIKAFEFNVYVFGNEIIKILPSMGMSYAFGFVLNNLLIDYSWSLFFIKCILFTAFYITFIWRYGANETERELVKNLVSTMKTGLVHS
ncbi:hypothetical protein CR203_16180 [Salipaludibacillus neizhouensis]|uniref:Polysaccharide biosynthesis protein C-terminal domain-containing protein n=1 Tax=Salipaludibacillus neizhouensis TaxID=885475 RepID=A0A3A9K503_9BACI|nr:oligosaccharide flippase family protein [Salipaludibacillus neizhouensis]RKL66428.1 hypothetical protein CR203_16180 [Salipaludibacillus neizhouensis]